MNRIASLHALRSLIAAAALVPLGLAGCSRHDAPAAQRPAPPATPAASAAPPAAAAVPDLAVSADPAIDAPEVDKPHAAELMQAIFGDAYRLGDGAASISIASGDEAGNWRMTLVAAKDLPDGRSVAVVNGAPADENGGDFAAHASPGMLNVYTLRRAGSSGATWQVLERHQDVETMGSSGMIGSVGWIELGGGKPGIVVYSGGTWFGSTIANAGIYDLDHGMRNLGSFAQMSSNEGACMPETADCWGVEGKIGTVPAARPADYRDIVVDFTGKHYRVTEDAAGKQVEHLKRAVRQRTRYRFDGKQYVLVAGENPVPSIDN